MTAKFARSQNVARKNGFGVYTWRGDKTDQYVERAPIDAEDSDGSSTRSGHDCLQILRSKTTQGHAMTDTNRVLRGLLRESAFFAHCADDALERLVKAFVPVTLEADGLIFEKGDPGDALYVITEGTVRIHDGELVLRRMGPGTVFGEVAALDRSPRTASITADTRTQLLRLPRQTLFDLMADEADVAPGIIQGLCAHLRTRIQDITESTLQQKMLEHELEIGRRIQAGFLPRVLPDIPGWNIAAHFHAAREVSGDFYDVFLHKCGRIALVIGDVCDKGVGAALFMTLFRSLIRAGANMEDFLSAPGAGPAPAPDHNDVLRRGLGLTNAYIARTHDDTSMFATVFFGLLDPQSGHLSYINAGHETPYVSRQEGHIEALDVTGPAVGLMAGARFGVGETTLEPGDAITLYTDGVVDARNPAGNEFSTARLCELLSVQRGPTTEIIGRVSGALARHGEGAKQFDDITLLSAARLPP